MLALRTTILAFYSAGLAIIDDVAGEVLPLYHLAAFVAAFDVFELAVACKVDSDFTNFILPSAAFAFISTIHFEIIHGTLDLLVSKHFEPTRVRTSSVRTSRSVRTRRFGRLFLHARLQAGVAEDISTAVSQVRISAG